MQIFVNVSIYLGVQQLWNESADPLCRLLSPICTRFVFGVGILVCAGCAVPQGMQVKHGRHVVSGLLRRAGELI